MPAKRAKARIHIKPSRKGLLHKELGVPEDQDIPADKLAGAAEAWVKKSRPNGTKSR